MPFFRGLPSTLSDKVFPEWKVHATFISRHLNEALDLDAKLSSHPIEVECPDANMINQIFDSLSYAKAASGTLSRRLLTAPLSHVVAL